MILLGAGCGDAGGQVAEGKAIFTGNCAGCHTLADVGTGVVGPNLDLKPPKALVIERVTNGKGAMPSFTDRFSGPYFTDAQIQAVAEYVSSAAGK